MRAFRTLVSGECDLLDSESKRYLGTVAPRPRVLAFGSAAALVLAGSICAVLVGGLTGEVLAIALITLGLGAAVLLVFLEVSLFGRPTTIELDYTQLQGY